MINQKDIRIGTHGENYGNWMSNPVFYMLGCFAAIAAILMIIFFFAVHSVVLGIIFALILTGLICVMIWFYWLRKQYAYGGGGIMDKVHQGLVPHLDFDGEGTILEVGCGSGPLAIRCALTWPKAKVIGLDYWGVSFDYDKELCEKNAALEGVGERCTFIRGDARKLDLPDESVDAVISNYVYHNIMGADQKELLLETLRVLKKGGVFAIHDIFSKAKYGDMQAFVRKLKDMGYEKAELIDTTDGKFMSRSEAGWMGLSGSALLVGKK